MAEDEENEKLRFLNGDGGYMYAIQKCHSFRWSGHALQYKNQVSK